MISAKLVNIDKDFNEFIFYLVVRLGDIKASHSQARDLREQFFTFETETEKNQSHKIRLRQRLKKLWSQNSRPIPRLMIHGINFRDQD